MAYIQVRLHYININQVRSDRDHPVLVYIDVASASVGVPEDFAFYLTSIANAGTGVGRLCAGFAADRMGTSPDYYYA